MIRLNRYQGTLVYAILGCDWLFLFAQFGGYAVVELQVHALFLTAAGLVLALNRQPIKLPLLGWALVTIPLLVFALLSLSVSPSAMAWLNPVKHHITEQGTTLFPQLQANAQLALNPPLHLFKGLRLVTDVATILIVINSPRPQFGLFRGIVRLIAGFVFILANMAAGGLLEGKGWLHRFEGTLGGIVNPNHFATASILILLLLLAINLREISKLRRRRNSARLDSEKVLRKMAFIALDWFLILLGFLAWRESQSRAGMILMVIALAFFACLLVWPILGKNRWLILPAGVSIAALLLLFVPFGSLISKWENEGTSFGNRTQALKVGLDYLQQGPWLGTGLQSSYTLLQNRMPVSEVNLTIWHEFHNEYVQILLEWGLLGAIWLILAAVAFGILVRLTLNPPQRPFFWAAGSTMILVVALHGLGEFPLRNPAIKMTLLIGIGFLIHGMDKTHWKSLPFGWLALPLACLAACLTAQSLKKAPDGPDLPGDRAAIARRYGRGFEVQLYRATAEFQRLMQGKLDDRSPETALQEIREDLKAYHWIDPLNLRCFNLWFATEVIEARLNGKPSFSELEEKARALRKLGAGPLDANADVSLFFLLEIYEPDLDSTHLAELQQLKKRYRAIQPK